MDGFVLKSHGYDTAPLAYVLNRMYPGLDVIGSIVLNTSIGGINPDAVDVAARLGPRVVWMPTMSAKHGVERQGWSGGISLLDGGKLKTSVLEVLEVASRYDIVVASGHVALDEALELFKQAKAGGVNRLLATHPTRLASVDEEGDMVALGALLEHTFQTWMLSPGLMTSVGMAETVKKLGAEHCVVTSGLGQWMNPAPDEGMRMAIAALLDAGMSVDVVEVLVKHNPSLLLSAGL